MAVIMANNTKGPNPEHFDFLFKLASSANDSKERRRREAQDLYNMGERTGDFDMMAEGYEKITGRKVESDMPAVPELPGRDSAIGRLADRSFVDINNEAQKSAFSKALGTDKPMAFNTPGEYDAFIRSGTALVGKDALSHYKEEPLPEQGEGSQQRYVSQASALEKKSPYDPTERTTKQVLDARTAALRKQMQPALQEEQARLTAETGKARQDLSRAMESYGDDVIDAASSGKGPAQLRYGKAAAALERARERELKDAGNNATKIYAVHNKYDRKQEALQTRFGNLFNKYDGKNLDNANLGLGKGPGSGAGRADFKYNVTLPGRTRPEPMTDAEVAALKASKAYRQNPDAYHFVKIGTDTPEGTRLKEEGIKEAQMFNRNFNDDLDGKTPNPADEGKGIPAALARELLRQAGGDRDKLDAVLRANGYTHIIP